MASNDGFRKYVEAGAALGQITRARAEEIVRELVGAGQVQGAQAQDWVDDLVERSRKASEDLLNLVRTEIATQLTALHLDPDDLAKQAADLLRHSADVGRRASKKAAAQATAAARAAKKSAGGKKAAKKSAGGKVAAKKAAPTKKRATAKKATAKKASPTKTAGAKKAAAKKSAGPAGDR